MRKEIIAGFVVIDSSNKNKTKKDEIAKCSECGYYGRQSEMQTKDHRYYCKHH